MAQLSRTDNLMGLGDWAVMNYIPDDSGPPGPIGAASTYNPGPAPAGYQWVQVPVYDDSGQYDHAEWQLIATRDTGGGGSRGYQPSGPLSIVSVEPAGYGYVRVTYSDGSQTLEVDRGQGGQQQQPYLDPNAPEGYVPIKDLKGNVISYQPSRAQTHYGDIPTGYVPIKDAGGNTIGYEPDRGYTNPEDTRRFDLTFNRDTQQWEYTTAEDKRRYEQNFGEDVRRFNIGQQNNQRDFNETVRQYDSDLNERIASRQQRLVEIEKQEAHADARQAAALAAEAANLRARIDADIKIAGMDNETKYRIAKMESAVGLRGQDVTQRGQELDYAATTRGQDIGRELGLRNLGADYAREAISLAGDDPMRSAAYLLGDKGSGITPGEAALAKFKDLLGTIQPVGAAPAPTPRVAPISLAAAGGARVLNLPQNGRRTINILVGDGRPTPEELVKIDARSGRLREIEPIHRAAAGGVDYDPSSGAPPSPQPKPDYPPPHGMKWELNAATGVWKAVPAAVPDAVPDTATRPVPVYTGSTVGGLTYDERGRPVSVLHAQQQADDLARAEAAKTRQWRRPNPVQMARDYYAKLQADRLAANGGGQPPATPPEGTPPTPPVEPGQPPTLPPAPVETTGDNGVAPTAENVQDTVARILRQAFYGDVPPEGGNDILSGRPLFGVDLADPKQMASVFFQLPHDVQANILSAWGLRNMSNAEAFRRMQVVTPIALQSSRFGYG